MPTIRQGKALNIDFLNERYYVGSLIGRGKIADVYFGQDYSLNREVAIKILRTALVRDPQLLKRFMNEARSAASLLHPNIVSVYDTGTHAFQDGADDAVEVPFVIMEHVEGKTLKEHLRKNALPIGRSINHALEILAALDYSHRAGVVHRDIRPANIMIADGDSTVKVTDFGISGTFPCLGKNGKIPSSSISSATMVPSAPIASRTLVTPELRNSSETVSYISPEQARGELVDMRSDLYSVGVVLYEMLAGQPLFKGESAVEVAFQHTSEAPTPLRTINPDIPAALEVVVMKALSKDPRKRFGTATDFSQALSLARREKLGYRSAYTRVVLKHNSANAGSLHGAADPSADAVDINSILPASKSRARFRKFVAVSLFLVAAGLATGIWAVKQ